MLVVTEFHNSVFKKGVGLSVSISNELHWRWDHVTFIPYMCFSHSPLNQQSLVNNKLDKLLAMCPHYLRDLFVQNFDQQRPLSFVCSRFLPGKLCKGGYLGLKFPPKRLTSRALNPLDIELRNHIIGTSFHSPSTAPRIAITAWSLEVRTRFSGLPTLSSSPSTGLGCRTSNLTHPPMRHLLLLQPALRGVFLPSDFQGLKCLLSKRAAALLPRCPKVGATSINRWRARVLISSAQQAAA